nr:hypothetical protein [Streptomyces sp. TSRI0107]
MEGRADLRDPDTAPAPGTRLRTPALLLRLPRPLGDDARHDPPPHRREHSHLARHAGGDSLNIQPLIDALNLQKDAARALAYDLRAHIDDLQTRLQEAETHLEHLAITRKTVTGLTDRLPLGPSAALPRHPDFPRILDAFNHATGPLRAKDVCEALGHELLPKNVGGTRAKLKRLVKLGILTETDTGNFARKQ